MVTRARLDCRATGTATGTRRARGSRNANHGAGASAGTRNNLPKLAGGIFEATGSQPAKDGVPGVGGARIENAARGNQGILRFAANEFDGAFDGQAKRHPGRIERKLRTIGPFGFDVLELFSAREREVGLAAS